MDILRGANYLGCGAAPGNEKEGNNGKAPALTSMARGLTSYISRAPAAASSCLDINLAEEEKQRRLQHLRMEAASTAKEWRNAAEKLDTLEGHHWWKFDEETDECNLNLIRERLAELKKANNEKNIPEMLAHVRTSMSRDLGGMCDLRLYQHTWYGTKAVIEEYTEVVKYTIEQLTKHCEEADLTQDELEHFLVEMKSARQAFGQSALLLSGGGTLGMCHIGVIKALMQENVLPRIVCGSSAGSIVGSVLCCFKSNAVMEKMEELCRGDLTCFQGVDEIQGIPGMAINLLKGKALFHVHNLCRVMREILGDMTFKEAFNHTGRILNIHVSCRDRHNLPRLLNYQTAPNVLVWSAVASSCALPIVFEAPGLQSKDPETNEIGTWGHVDHKWIDGSIEGDLPAQIMERLFNVNNFIVSQVNPHVVMFLPNEEDSPNGKPMTPTIVRRLMSVTAANAVWYLDGLIGRGWDALPIRMAHSVLSQRYDGDITIMPDVSWVNWLKILANPSSDFMNEASRQGERATWPKLDRIRNHVAIELALSDGIKQIQIAKITSKMRHNTRFGHAGTNKSEHDLHRMGRQGPRVGFDPAITGGRAKGNRTALHLQRRSMVEPNALLTQSPLPPALTLADSRQKHTQQTSSSDEQGSSDHSSPDTSYGEEEWNKNTDKRRPRASAPETLLAQALPAFLSQPTTPSGDQRFHFGPGTDNGVSPGQSHLTLTPSQQNYVAAHAPELKRMLHGLKMSSIKIKDPPAGSVERRRSTKK